MSPGYRNSFVAQEPELDTRPVPEPILVVPILVVPILVVPILVVPILVVPILVAQSLLIADLLRACALVRPSGGQKCVVGLPEVPGRTVTPVAG